PPSTAGKTGGLVGHVQEPLGSYIQRVSVEDNFMQRPPFDHSTDPVYKRLIKDFITGAAMPEAKVAALSRTEVNKKATSLDDSNIYFSIIDGLQRLYCFCIALLLVLRRERLVRDACITNESWLYFQEAVAKTADSRAATEEPLQRVVRYEIFYQIDLAGLL